MKMKERTKKYGKIEFLFMDMKANKMVLLHTITVAR